MLTYDLTGTKDSLYKQIYQNIREDVRSGKLSAHEKMPSKRALAQNLNVSIVTVEHAYDQLVSEGYLYSRARRGYFVSDIGDLERRKPPKPVSRDIRIPEEAPGLLFDFSSNRTEREHFPFSVWARLMREVISLREQDLLVKAPCSGVDELRQAITDHLASFRGINVDPAQVIVGAGTEYLYSLLVKLIGTDSIYCIENPGYRKLMKIYDSNGAPCVYAGLDEQGIRIEQLRSSGASIAHISPTHHFPTGITMPAARRYELLAWAYESQDRYIIEDDYDSEFRLSGKPIPALASMDAGDRVIYMNTFSKSLTSTIRISYMVLPENLANLFYKKLSFYSCTVSTFEQYTLAAFISQGYFEKHINRMRRYYRKKREKILEVIREVFDGKDYRILEKDSGLHMILEFNTNFSDRDLKEKLEEKQVRIATVSDYYMGEAPEETHQFLLNYSNIDIVSFPYAMRMIRDLL